MKTPEVCAQSPKRLQTGFKSIMESQLLSTEALRPLALKNVLLSKGVMEQQGNSKVAIQRPDRLSFILESCQVKPKVLVCAESSGITSLSSSKLTEALCPIPSVWSENKLLSSATSSSLLQSACSIAPPSFLHSTMHLDVGKGLAVGSCARTEALTSVAKGKTKVVSSKECGTSASKPSLTCHDMITDVAKQQRDEKDVKQPVEDDVLASMPLYNFSSTGETETLPKLSTKKGLLRFKDCSPNVEYTCQETKVRTALT
ncbi:uncharacterized protein LOC122790321 [Protopterus annectens]|uniref:uncharacterized protein LOC122790321 n=1 Tax=Protopterus annectens TaxID=7888 RepID=UPI001CFB43A6|nr:uncharacterized protein LOC122790321 [Protopterus annectens]XP_043913780.1 uncharacterized protein LOC122790321 [Protopterus annectens]